MEVFFFKKISSENHFPSLCERGFINKATESKRKMAERFIFHLQFIYICKIVNFIYNSFTMANLRYFKLSPWKGAGLFCFLGFVCFSEDVFYFFLFSVLLAFFFKHTLFLRGWVRPKDKPL